MNRRAPAFWKADLSTLLAVVGAKWGDWHPSTIFSSLIQELCSNAYYTTVLGTM